MPNPVKVGETILDALIRSPQKFITRYHLTTPRNVEPILKNGIEPRMGGNLQDILVAPTGIYDKPHPEMAHKAVFTSSRQPYHKNFHGRYVDTYQPYEGVILRVNIPKEEYRNIKRADFNREIGESVNYRDGESHYKPFSDYFFDDDGRMHFGKMKVYSTPDDRYKTIATDGTKNLQAIPYGGRTDIFEDMLKPEWITGGYTFDGYYDKENLLDKVIELYPNVFMK